jgi:uncharacterized protein (DUF983 family)
MRDTGPSGSKQMGQSGLAKAALFGLCPQCDARALFDGPTNFSAQCRRCGLGYTKFNVGDGPAALLTMAIGALIIVLALIVDTAFRPPFWVHAVIWVPVTAGLVVILLRFTKAALLILEYRNQAGEGKMDKEQ